MQFNLLSFKLPTDPITINLYFEKVKETYPQAVYADECPELWKQHAKHFIYTYFRGRVLAVSYNFVDGIEIWIKKDQQQSTTKFSGVVPSINPYGNPVAPYILH